MMSHTCANLFPTRHELCIKVKSISVFLDITKVVDFRLKSADVSTNQEVCRMIYVFFGSSLRKV